MSSILKSFEYICGVNNKKSIIKYNIPVLFFLDMRLAGKSRRSRGHFQKRSNGSWRLVLSPRWSQGEERNYETQTIATARLRTEGNNFWGQSVGLRRQRWIDPQCRTHAKSILSAYFFFLSADTRNWNKVAVTVGITTL